MNALKNRYEFVILFDVKNGNPNGDPDNSNYPRVDPETEHGLVTDVCIKRKIRDYIDTVKSGETGYNLYIRDNDVCLNKKDEDAVKFVGEKKKDEVLRYMCDTYFDIRTFGAVMTTFSRKENTDNGHANVTGPVQLGFGESIDEIMPMELSVTRCAITTEEDAKTKDNTFGKKYIVPYGLYKMNGYISANLAEKTGFSEDDLEVLWDAILNMFEEDRAAARGDMAVRKLIIFKHDSVHGNARAYKLFELVDVHKKDGVDVPRSFSDYEVNIGTDVPSGVEVIVKD